MSEIQLGAFVLEDPIGQGGMGEVWRGRHPGTGMPVAVKMIKPDIAAGGRFHASFKKEIESVAALDHPGIVLVFDHGAIDEGQANQSNGRLRAGEPYLVTEFASGGSYDRRSRPKGWSELRGLLLSLLDALGHAHAHGVVHLDLKPGNLLNCTRTDFRPGLKLTDFGLAQVLSELRKQTSRKLAGTPQYMAPEQFSRRAAGIGPWTDLYAVGCLAWELACGRRVFPYDEVQELMRAHVHEPPPAFSPNFALPVEFEEWVRTCLEKAPAARFGHAADAAWALMGLGEAVDLDRTTVDLGLSDTSTFAFQTLAPLSFAAGQLDEPLTGSASDRSWGRPPMPRDWRAPLVERPLRLLDDAGSGLFGLRTVPFVGRDALRDRLWHELGAVRATGRARALVLHGRPGVGKTRLAQWLGVRASELGAARFFEARYAADEQGIQALLAREFSEDTDDARERSQRLHAALDRQDRPVVLVLDEADRNPEAAAFARRLLRFRDAAPVPVLVLLTTEDIGRGFERLTRMDGADELAVPPLEAQEGRMLVRGLLALERRLAGLVEHKSSGNPEYAIQLVGDWLARGLLVASSAGFVLVEGADVRLPASLREVWAERLEPLLAILDDAEVESLYVAAILGSSPLVADWEEGCRLAGVDAEDGGLEELIHNGLVQRSEAGWVFREALVRELLLERADEVARWADLHDACSRIEGLDDERLGLFLREAGRLEGCIEPITRAARTRCIDNEDYGGSLVLVDLAERALDQVGAEPGDLRRFHLKRRRLVCIANSWDFAEVRVHSAALLNEAETWGWPTHDLHAILATNLAVEGDHEAARQHILLALSMDGVDTEQRAQLLSIRSHVAMSARDYDAVLAAAHEARRLLDSIDERDSFARARNDNDLGEASRLTGDLDAALEHYADAIRICRALGQASMFVTLNNKAIVHLLRREHEAAQELLSEIIRDAPKHYAIYPEVYARCLMLEVAAELQDTALWDRSVHGLEPRFKAQPFNDNDLAESLTRAGRVMSKLAPRRARYALEMARNQHAALGRTEDAQSVELLLGLLPSDTAS